MWGPAAAGLACLCNDLRVSGLPRAQQVPYPHTVRPTWGFNHTYLPLVAAWGLVSGLTVFSFFLIYSQKTFRRTGFGSFIR